VQFVALAALARALRLSNFERDHLLRLAGYGPPADHAPTPCAAMRRLVDQLNSTPAAIYDLCWNPLAWNPMWAAVNGDPLSRPARARNMMWSFMTGLPSRVKRNPDQVLRSRFEIPPCPTGGLARSLRAMRPSGRCTLASMRQARFGAAMQARAG
jgi:MmyB-like transcription regulator ligand binding domain